MNYRAKKNVTVIALIVEIVLLTAVLIVGLIFNDKMNTGLKITFIIVSVVLLAIIIINAMAVKRDSIRSIKHDPMYKDNKHLQKYMPFIAGDRDYIITTVQDEDEEHKHDKD